MEMIIKMREKMAETMTEVIVEMNLNSRLFFLRVHTLENSFLNTCINTETKY